MKKLLICGATGFIGRNLVEHFSKLGEYSVKAVYNKRPPLHDVPNVQWVQADLNNAADVERVVDGADVVLQYAATTSGSVCRMARATASPPLIAEAVDLATRFFWIVVTSHLQPLVCREPFRCTLSGKLLHRFHSLCSNRS